MVGEPAEIEVGAFEWSEESVGHIAQHEVMREDVEAILANSPLFFQNLPGRSATHIMIGLDGKGRVLYVPIRCVREPDMWQVVTAWESRYARRLLNPEGKR